MMGWEEPLMIAHTKLVKSALKEKMERGEGLSVLNIGFGLGIVCPLLSLFYKLPLMNLGLFHVCI
jgi:ubiquinone/menaquinone biosynthesis C-methylase UbiE